MVWQQAKASSPSSSTGSDFTARSSMCETRSLPRCQETRPHTIDCLGASGINLLDQAVLAALCGMAKFVQTHTAREAIKFNEISSAWLKPVWIFFNLGCHMRTHNLGYDKKN